MLLQRGLCEPIEFYVGCRAQDGVVLLQRRLLLHVHLLWEMLKLQILHRICATPDEICMPLRLV